MTDDGWTVEALRILVDANDRRYDAQFAAQDKAVTAALAAAEKAVIKAETAADKRFASVNEFRQTLSDQAATFVTRAEVEQRREADGEKVNDLKGRLDRIEGRSTGLNAGWVLLGQAVALIVAVALVLSK